jgi:hypothetical protein
MFFWDWVNVKRYGATGDGETNDTGEINEAIELVGGRGGGIVYFPRGEYVIRSSLNVNGSGVVLLGCGSSSVLVIRQCTDPFFPFPVHFRREDGLELVGGGIRDMAIRYEPDSSMAVPAVVFSNCADWFCERVLVTGGGRGMNGSTASGIAAQEGSRNGVISGCVADGLSSAGFLLDHTQGVIVQGCMARNMSRGADGPPSRECAGMQVTSSNNITVKSFHSADNQGSGLLIDNSEADVLFRTIDVHGGFYTGNQRHGIEVGAAESEVGIEAIGADLKITGAQCSGNSMNGVLVSSVEGAVIQGCICTGNGSGIVVTDVPSSRTGGLTRRVEITGTIIEDNRLNGILVTSADDVTIEATTIRRGDPSLQTGGAIQTTAISYDGFLYPIQNLVLRSLSIRGYDNPESAITATTAVQSGHFALQLNITGGVSDDWSAPLGSVLTNVYNGRMYVRTDERWSQVTTGG